MNHKLKILALQVKPESKVVTVTVYAINVWNTLQHYRKNHPLKLSFIVKKLQFDI